MKSLAAVLLVCFGAAVRTQEVPNPRLEPNQFNFSTTFRQSFCARYQEVADGRVSIGDALQGYEITSLLTLGDTYLKLDKSTGGLDEEYPGLVPVLMDEVCARAGCSWRNTFTVLQGPAEGRSWSELLVWVQDTYDIGLDWWMASVERMSNGVAFAEPWFDASLIMITRKPESDREFSLWTFLEPFENNVWLMLVVTTFGSGLVYHILEKLNPKADKGRLEDSLVESSFLVAITLTTHFTFTPRTNPARLLSFSVAFFALVVSASYTANLASFLVMSNQGGFEFDTLEAAVRADKTICVYGGTNSDEVVSKAFPLARIIRVSGAKEVLEGARDEKCDVGISTLAAWNEFRRSEEITGGCRLEWVGRAFMNIPAGFVTKADSGVFCTNLVRDVISIHMAQMKVEGFVDEAWKEHLNRATNDECFQSDSPADEESTRLTLTHMGGIFAFHAMLTAGALAMGLTSFFYDRYGDKEKILARKSRRAAMEDGDDDNSRLTDVDMDKIRRDVKRLQQVQQRDMETIDEKLQLIMSRLGDNENGKKNETSFIGSFFSSSKKPASSPISTKLDSALNGSEEVIIFDKDDDSGWF